MLSDGGVRVRRVTGLVALAILAAPSPSRSQAPAWQCFIPRWNQGDTWNVQFRLRYASEDPKTAPQKGHAFVLNYQVAEVREVTGQREFLIRVACPADPERLHAALAFAGDVQPGGALRNLAMIRYEYQYRGPLGPVKDDMQVFRLSDKPFPVLTGNAALPLDFPYFDRKHKNSTAFPDYESAEFFKVKEPSPDFWLAANVLQRIRKAGIAQAIPPEAGLGERDLALEILFIRRSDFARARQIWQEGQPWYVWAEAAGYEAVLQRGN